jgi:ubiquinone/menaquinone biosynthesis C-methylase UbiE
MKEEFESYLSYFGVTVDELEFPLLDVGVGDGDFVQYCKDVLGHEDAVGLDISNEKMLNADAIVMGDAANMPFADESFRMVVSKHLLPAFVTDEDMMEKMVSEMLRVLQKGGRLMFDFKTKKSIDAWEKEFRHLFPDQSLDEAEYAREIEGTVRFSKYLEGLRDTVTSLSFSEHGIAWITK